jgi:hypothetical protein
MHYSERQTREIIEEIRTLLDAMDLKIIASERLASPQAKQEARRDILSDHRLAVKHKQRWR